MPQQASDGFNASSASDVAPIPVVDAKRITIIEED